jgi:hypothetical protein
MKKLTEEEFKKLLELKNKYFGDYFLISGKFMNCRTKIKVTTKYGDCLANPYSLLDGNKPTIQTAIDKNGFFTEMAKEIHGDKFDYSKVEYKSYSTKVSVICPHHGLFLQKPNCHLSGKGCPECNKGGWDFKLRDWLNTKSDSATFYILKCYCDDEMFIKIGITSTSIKERYRKNGSMPYDFDILHETTSSNKKLIWELERKFLNKLKGYSYNPKKDFGGKTECFNIEILNKLYD